MMTSSPWRQFTGAGLGLAMLPSSSASRASSPCAISWSGVCQRMRRPHGRQPTASATLGADNAAQTHLSIPAVAA
jgi:hypothetical protein